MAKKKAIKVIETKGQEEALLWKTDPANGAMPEKENSRKLEVFKLYFAHLLSCRQLNHDRLDTTIIMLSSGYLGLSLAFIKDVVPVKDLISLTPLWISWVLFAMPIISTLGSHWLSSNAIEREVCNATDYYLQ